MYFLNRRQYCSDAILQNLRSHLCLDNFSFNRAWQSSTNLCCWEKLKVSWNMQMNYSPNGTCHKNNTSAFSSTLLWPLLILVGLVLWPFHATERQSSLLASINTAGEHRAKCTGDVKQAVSAVSGTLSPPCSFSCLSPTKSFKSMLS